MKKTFFLTFFLMISLSALSASRVLGGTVTTITNIPSPKGSFKDTETDTTLFRPGSTPSPCPTGTLYYNSTTNSLEVCTGGTPSSVSPWVVDGSVVRLRDSAHSIADELPNRAPGGLTLNSNGHIVALRGAGGITSVDVSGLGRDTAGLVFDASDGSLAVGWNVLLGGSLDLPSGGYRFGDDNVVLAAGSILGGSNNRIELTAAGSVIGGGTGNTAANLYNFIGGGQLHTINAESATIGGGDNNVISAGANYATIAGGSQNNASGLEAFIGGGSLNSASGSNSVVVGGGDNGASGTSSFVGGGGGNRATGNFSAILGGSNTASGLNSVAIGTTNIVSGNNSIALGFERNISSTDTLALGFANGVAINRNNARILGALDVNAGDILFDTNHYAAGGYLPLRIVGANVEGDGIVTNNYGISSVTRVSPGVYTINFPAFNAPPLVQVTLRGIMPTPLFTSVPTILTTSVTVLITDAAIAPFDQPFSVTIIGVRNANLPL